MAEAKEAEVWPEAGVRVAVGVEHLLHTLRLGEEGVCEAIVADDPSEVIVSLDNVVAELQLGRR